MSSLPERVFIAGEEPEGDRVHRYFELELLARVISCLTAEELQRFRESQFGTLLEIDNSFAYSGKLVHFLFTRQLKIRKKHEIWFVFAGKPIRFALPDFKAVTGMCCGKIPVKPKNQPKRKSVDQGGETPFRYTLFGSEKCVNPEFIAQCLEKKLIADSENRIRCAGLVLLYGLILPRSGGGALTEKEIEVVKDLDEFFKHPWGRVSFNLLMSTIKLKEPKHLAKPSIAVQGFAHAIQLVLLKAVPDIEATMPAANTVVVRLDESDPTLQPPPQKLRKLRLDHVREVDKEGKVEVSSVVGTVEDDWDSEMEWSDEVSDEEVSALVDLLSEGHAFVSSEFIGGVRPGDVPILAEKEPAGKGKQKKAVGGRKRARKSASGISPPESLGFTEAQMKWIEEYVQKAVQSATSAPTDPGISKEKTPGKEQMGGPSATPGKAPESSSRKRKGPPKKRNPTAKRYRSKHVTDPDTPTPHTAAGDDDVPRERDDDGDEQPNPDTRSHDPMEDADTAGGEQTKEGSVEDEPKTDDSASRHSTVEPPSESNAQASTVTPDQTDDGQTKEGSAEDAQEADGSVPRHSPLKRAVDGDAMADSTAAGQGVTNVVGVSVTADKVGEDIEVEGDSSEHTPSPPATNPHAPTKEATPDEPGNTSDQSRVNEAADEGKTSEQNPSSPVTVTHAATKESTPSPPKPSASSEHLSPVSPGQVINSVVSQLSAQDKDTGAEVDVQGGDSSQKAMDFLNKTG